MKPRQQKSDTIAGLIDAMANAAAPPPEPPAHVRLRDGDRPFWEGVIRARARDEWTESDLVVGAQLARCQADIEREQLALDAEGSTVENQRGTMVANPRFTVLQQLAQREMALMRALRMGGRVMGETDKLGVRRGLQRQAERALESVADEDELLAL